jgi:hypothetical protein
MKAGERELLRFGFHRLALTFPTLNEATLSSVQVQHIGDGHFLALCRAVAGGVVPGRYGCEYLARPTAGLIGGEHTIPPDSHEATLGVPTAAPSAIPNDERLGATGFDAEAEPSQLRVPSIPPSADNLRRIDGPFR